jgi:hypothetical protein
MDNLHEQEELSGTETAWKSGKNKAVAKRALVFVVAVVVALWSVMSFKANLIYFFANRTPVNIGDVRQLRAKGVTKLDVKPNSYVRMENLIVGYPELETKKYRFFFCPIYNVLVRTESPLPEVSLRVGQTEIPEGLEYLVEQHRVPLEFFATHFDAEGWLMPVTEAPGFKAGIEEFLRKNVRLSDSEIREAYALLDKETPNKQIFAVLILFAGIFIVCASGWSLVKAIRQKQT